jgi:hypothetical protein
MTINLLASSGDGWDMKSGGVGYDTRDFDMPLDDLAVKPMNPFPKTDELTRRQFVSNAVRHRVWPFTGDSNGA